MITGKTKTGFKYEIDDKQLNNYELLEFFAEVDENPFLLPKAMKMLLGKDQMDKLKEHVRDKDGIVDAEVISKEIADIFSESKEVKN
ncbi:hypothetical protein [Facklamia sp. 7083-14-GEN3]|uniref:hypothetical protein n=1 Tax=Facklamia sp. 7083-14-GEN3 TaxID=2973478 RepID=UPI00215B77A5|nr:hypothetical protein [Facklamia sp. 7083-14-GEN3]MCR8969272.1 hypothetical protein [Facklamia sp. 7083-14-GEN3]